MVHTSEPIGVNVIPSRVEISVVEDGIDKEQCVAKAMVVDQDGGGSRVCPNIDKTKSITLVLPKEKPTRSHHNTTADQFLYSHLFKPPVTAAAPFSDVCSKTEAEGICPVRDTLGPRKTKSVRFEALVWLTCHTKGMKRMA
jgi:hypothetical protein